MTKKGNKTGKTAVANKCNPSWPMFKKYCKKLVTTYKYACKKNSRKVRFLHG